MKFGILEISKEVFEKTWVPPPSKNFVPNCEEKGQSEPAIVRATQRLAIHLSRTPIKSLHPLALVVGSRDNINFLFNFLFHFLSTKQLQFKHFFSIILYFSYTKQPLFLLYFLHIFVLTFSHLVYICKEMKHLTKKSRDSKHQHLLCNLIRT